MAAILAAVLLLAPSAGVIALTTDRPLRVDMFVLATITADLILCIFLGLACMLFGYCVAVLRGEWRQPQWLLGFGAALALIVFTAITLLGRIMPGGPTTSPPSNSGAAS